MVFPDKSADAGKVERPHLAGGVRVGNHAAVIEPDKSADARPSVGGVCRQAGRNRTGGVVVEQDANPPTHPVIPPDESTHASTRGIDRYVGMRVDDDASIEAHQASNSFFTRYRGGHPLCRWVRHPVKRAYRWHRGVRIAGRERIDDGAALVGPDQRAVSEASSPIELRQGVSNQDIHDTDIANRRGIGAAAESADQAKATGAVTVDHQIADRMAEPFQVTGEATDGSSAVHGAADISLAIDDTPGVQVAGEGKVAAAAVKGTQVVGVGRHAIGQSRLPHTRDQRVGLAIDGQRTGCGVRRKAVDVAGIGETDIAHESIC